MELAETNDPLKLTADRRPTMPEPLPVRLVAVEDVVLIAAPGIERALNELYVGLLRLERIDTVRPVKPPTEPILGESAPVLPPARIDRPLPRLASGAIQGPVYRAENRRISFQIHEPLIERAGLRPLGIEVPSLVAAGLELDRREIEYIRQRGLYPGGDSILLQDPGGNWLELGESRPI